MKKLIQAVIIFLALQSVCFSQNSVIDEIINKTNIDSLRHFVRELSGDVQTVINGSPYTILSRTKNQPATAGVRPA